nr:class I SAM-dependent methyltransferase [uncultured Duganella sp.]
MSAGFYRAFEDRYRGARETIKARLAAYAPFIAPLATLQRPPRALDVGCGRGEWLELLGEQGFAAHGVDLDDGMLAACRERGLSVELGDAIDCLRRLPDASVALVSAFHLVEHIPFDLLQALVAEAQRVLLPGGLLIMETPNAENLVVGATSFYLDPTHLRPLPPQLLAFVAEYGGFARPKVVRLQEDPALCGDAPIGLINVLDGVSPDYAVVAQKAAPEAVLAPFAAAFAADYGLALAPMALRFEQRLLARDAAQRDAVARLEQHTIDGKLRLDAAERALDGLTRLVEASAAQLSQQAAQQAAQTAALRGRLDEVAHQRAEAEARIAALLASSSWRITAPWRMAGGYARRARAGARARLKTLVLRLAGAAMRRPLAYDLARRLLARTPALQARLQAMLHRGAGGPPRPAESPAPLGDMTPRGTRIYQDLHTALKTRKH